MEVTCLSKGHGLYYPSCYIFNVEGLTVLVDCPLDLSALKIFSPLPAVMNDSILSPTEWSNKFPCLIFEEPWYKTVANLHLWDPCLIDVVLISSTMGLLGLPYLTRVKGFSAKVYVTEATAGIGKLIMEDLVSMHTEFIQFYGIKDSESPNWMKWETLESFPSSLREVASGQDGAELGGWLPLYSAMDVQECMVKLNMLKYNEEVTYNGILVIKPFSCGSEIGSCNWGLNGPHGTVACISGCDIASACAMEFDHRIFEKRDVVIITNFSCHSDEEDIGNELLLRDLEDRRKVLTDHLTDSEAEEKLTFVSTCCLDTVKAGGSVLLPLYSIGTILRLIVLLSDFLESSATKVPIYFVSSVAQEIIAAVNVMPEWLSQDQQEKMFSGEMVCANTGDSRAKRFNIFSAVHSAELLTNWQEPCIIFCSHWTLRLGPAVHFLKHFSKDCNSLLVLEDDLDADMSLMPFKPIKMKTLKCNFSSSMRVQSTGTLIKHFQPTYIVLPDDLKQHHVFSNLKTPSQYYSEGETIRIHSLKLGVTMEIASDVVSSLKWGNKISEADAFSLARLNGQVSVESGQLVLSAGDNVQFSGTTPCVFWGKLDTESLLADLANKGIIGSVETNHTENNQQHSCIIQIHEPDRAVIRIEDTSSTITSSNVNLAACIYDIMINSLDCV